MGVTRTGGREGLPGNNNFKIMKAGADKLGYKECHTGNMSINSAERDGRNSCKQTGFCFQGCKWGAKWSTLYTEIPKGEATGKLEVAPDTAAFNNRGKAWGIKGELDVAIADFNEAIRLDPGNAEAYFNRATAWSVKGDEDKASPDFKEAIRLRPQYADFLNKRSASSSGNIARVSAAVPTEPGQNASDLVSKLDAIIETDARRWVFNRYKKGSLRNVKILESDNNGSPSVVYASYTYNNVNTGWVKLKFANGNLRCLEFWDMGGICRRLGQVPSQGLMGAIIKGLATDIMTGGGTSGHGEDAASRSRELLDGMRTNAAIENQARGLPPPP
jgi:tetratricopeptide (TPR) repeat protein